VLGGVQRQACNAHGLRSQTEQEVPHRRRTAGASDELAHHADATAVADGSGFGPDVAGDQPQQRRLAGAVRADERDLAPLANAKAHIVEELVAADRVAQLADIDESRGGATMAQRVLWSGEFRLDLDAARAENTPGEEP